MRHVAPSQKHQRHLYAELAQQAPFKRCSPKTVPMLEAQVSAMLCMTCFGQHSSALTHDVAEILLAAWPNVAASLAVCLGSAAQA